MNDYYIFLIALGFFILAAYIFIAIVQLCRKIAFHHSKIMQFEEEASRREIEETIVFFEDESGSALSAGKKAVLRRMIADKLRQEKQAKKEEIKKAIIDEVIRVEQEKRKKIKKETLTLIIKNVLSTFRKEFFRKVKKSISNSLNKQSNSAQRQKQREQEKARREREQRRQEENRRDDERNLKKEEERRKKEQEEERQKNEQEERLRKEKEQEEKRRKQEEERKDKALEDMTREEKIQKLKDSSSKGKTNSVAQAVKSAGGR